LVPKDYFLMNSSMESWLEKRRMKSYQPKNSYSMSVDSPRYVLNQLKIFVAVGKDIKIVTPEK
jgi:hypothetical protein